MSGSRFVRFRSSRSSGDMRVIELILSLLERPSYLKNVGLSVDDAFSAGRCVTMKYRLKLKVTSAHSD